MTANSTLAEVENMNGLMGEYANIIVDESNIQKWQYTEDGNITNGLVTLSIGDYVDYDCTTSSESYTSTITLNGYGDQTFKASDYIYGWRVLGVDEETGELQIISEDLIGPTTGGESEYNRTYYYLSGQAGYVNGVEELRKISEIYGKGKGATGARSITVEDVNKITGYNPNNIGVYDPEQTGVGTKTFEGKINEYGNKVTYTKIGDSEIQYTSTNDVTGAKSFKGGFTYYSDNQWKSLSIGESTEIINSYKYYYPYTLTESDQDSIAGLEKSSTEYKMLFTNSSSGADINNAGTITGFSYWLANTVIQTNEGYVTFGMSIINSDRMGIGYLYHSNNTIISPKYGVRPVVSLKSNISLKDSLEKIDQYTLWNIE
mgnify:CR=1 FL=1